MIPQYGVSAGSALTTVVHAEDAQPNESIQGQKRKRALPPRIMTSTPQPRYTNVPIGMQAVKSGLQYATRSRPWRGGKGGYANRGGRQGSDGMRDKPNDRYGGSRHPRSEDAIDKRAKIVSVSEDTRHSANWHKRPRQDSDNASIGAAAISAEPEYHGYESASIGPAPSTERLNKRRRVKPPGIHDVGEEVIIGPRSPETNTVPPPGRAFIAQPAPQPQNYVDLTFLDEPGLFMMPKSPQSPQPDDGLTSPLYVPFIPATVDMRPLSPIILPREESPVQPHDDEEVKPRSPSPFLLPSLRRKTSLDMYEGDGTSLSSERKPPLPTRQNLPSRTRALTPPSPSPRLSTPFLPPLNSPVLPTLQSLTMGDQNGVGASTTPKRFASSTIKQETLVSPSLATNAGPSRKLITGGCEFFPMPESCNKTHPDFKENRKTFARDKWRHLQAFGFIRKKCTVREDGLAIEWESPVPVWSDTYMKDTAEAPSLADAIQLSLTQNHRSRQSISTSVLRQRKKEDILLQSKLPSTDNEGNSAGGITEDKPSSDPIIAPIPAHPSTPPRRLPSVKKPNHFISQAQHAQPTIQTKSKSGSVSATSEMPDVDEGVAQRASQNPKSNTTKPQKGDKKGGRVILSLEEALMASLTHNASHIRRIKKSDTMKGHFEDEDDDEEEEDEDDSDDSDDEDDEESEDDEEDEEAPSPVAKTKRKRSPSDSAPVIQKKARVSDSRTATTRKPHVVEVIDLTLDDTSDEEEQIGQKRSRGAVPARPAPSTKKGTRSPRFQQDFKVVQDEPIKAPETATNTNADEDVEMGNGPEKDQTEPEVKKMVFKPVHAPRRRERSPPVFTNPWESSAHSYQSLELEHNDPRSGHDVSPETNGDSVFVSLEDAEALMGGKLILDGGLAPRAGHGDRDEVITGGGVDGRDEKRAEHGNADSVQGMMQGKEDQLMYPPTPDVSTAVIPMQRSQMNLARLGVDAISGSSTGISTNQDEEDFPPTIRGEVAPTNSKRVIPTISTSHEDIESLLAVFQTLPVPVPSRSEYQVIHSNNYDGVVVDGGRHLGGGGNNCEGVISASPTMHMKIDEDEGVGNVVDLSLCVQTGGDLDGIEKVAEQFLEKYIASFDSDPELLGEAYADSALFSCSAVGCEPSAGSLTALPSSGPSRAISAVSQELSLNPKISQGRPSIISALKKLVPFQFYLREDFSVYYDLAPLPRLNNAQNIHAHKGGKIIPMVDVESSARNTERYLLSVHAQMYNASNPLDVTDRLAVDQSFLLSPRGSGGLESSKSYSDRGTGATSNGDLTAWPLTIHSHQMTLRRTPLLSEEKLVELLPWAQEILR